MFKCCSSYCNGQRNSSSQASQTVSSLFQGGCRQHLCAGNISRVQKHLDTHPVCQRRRHCRVYVIGGFRQSPAILRGAQEATVAIFWPTVGKDLNLSRFMMCVHVYMCADVQREQSRQGDRQAHRVPVRSGARWSVSRNDT